MANTRFDLETAISACWNTVDDLDLVIEAGDESDNDIRLNNLIGLKAICTLRLQRVTDIFEELIATRQLQ